MLPILFTVTVPAGWGPWLAVLLAVVIGLARALAFRAGHPGKGPRPSLWEALRADGWFLGILAVALVVAQRSGALSGTLRLPLHTYGLLMAAAFLLGVLLAQREARRQGQRPEQVADLAFWILVAAVVGSQVFYVLLNLEEFSGARFLGDPPFQAVPRFLLVWKTGLVFYGGFIGATLAAYVYMRRHRMPFLAYADTLIPSVAIGHFLGRLGCFSAGCCWGGLTHSDLPWAVHFPPGSSAYEAFVAGGYPARFFTADGLSTAGLHPTQLYEAFGELLLFALLVLVVRPRRRFQGQLLASWLIAYACLRGLLELFRGDLARHAYLGLNSGQWISVAILAAGLALWVRAPRPAPGAAV
jgi:phosphatidylglycerol---prolipoprotein diacylglyceryl transferase